MVLAQVQKCVDDEEAIVTSQMGVPPVWDSVLCRSSSLKHLSFIIKLNILEVMSISMIPRHLLGSERPLDLGTGTRG